MPVHTQFSPRQRARRPQSLFDSVKHRAERNLTMYHTMVKRIATKNFERVNEHDYDAILKDCAAEIHHRFGGDHALGGERHDRDALRRWFERLGRLLPTLKLTVRDVWVKGWPHNTTVIVRWIGTQDLPNGAPYENQVCTSCGCAGERPSTSMPTKTPNSSPSTSKPLPPKASRKHSPSRSSADPTRNSTKGSP